MAKDDVFSDRAQPSLLDRLIDKESTRGYDPNRLTESIRRDLENLLNTRLTAIDLRPEFAEVRHSVLNYGIPDLSSFDHLTVEQNETLLRVIESQIAAFEPRLTDVQVSRLPESSDPDHSRRNKFTVPIHVHAQLNVDPYFNEIDFDTMLQITTNHYEVKQAAK